MANPKEESLEEKLQRLISETDSLKEANTTFAAANNTLKDQIEAVTSENAATTTKLADLTEQYEHLKEEFTSEITSLSAELAKSKIISDEAKPTITVDGKDYLVLGKKFKYQHKEYTLQSLRQDEALQRALVNIGAGFLVPVPDNSQTV